jgi:tetratricopeptide (TPR) repeat protein
MQTHMNVNPSLDIVRAMNEGVALSNAAVAASRRGDHATAAELHQQALALKIAGHGEASIQTAISFNGLGEEMLALGRLDEAEHALQSALRVREVGQMSLGLDGVCYRSMFTEESDRAAM